MMAPNFLIRQCRSDDYEAAVPLIHSSGPAAYHYVFSHRSQNESLKFLQQAFIDGNSEFGWKHHYAVTQNNQLVAVGGIKYASQNFRFMITALKQIIDFYGAIAGSKVCLRGLKTESVIKPPRKNLGMIYDLAVTPEFRCQGIGQLLINYLLKQIRINGFDRAALDVAETNPRAKQLYERLGFQARETRHSHLSSVFGEVANHTYMEKAL